MRHHEVFDPTGLSSSKIWADDQVRRRGATFRYGPFHSFVYGKRGSLLLKRAICFCMTCPKACKTRCQNNKYLSLIVVIDITVFGKEVVLCTQHPKAH